MEAKPFALTIFKFFLFFSLMPPNAIVGNFVRLANLLYLYIPNGLFDFFDSNNGDMKINCTPWFSLILISFIL